VRGPDDAPLAVVYGDYECPFCAALEVRLRELEIRVAFRHFPVRASHPRAQAAAHAAEAAAAQGAFWPMHDSLFDDQGRLEDPHLWARAERLGLDLAWFEADRRSEGVADRVREQFRGGVRAGVVTTPTAFVDGKVHAGRDAIDWAVGARLRG
jgi:protein-disulfide isomerase